MDAMPQLSEEPPSISAAMMLALPLASSCTVTGWQMTIGAMLSWTVTVVEQVLTLPLLSVTVKVTG